MVKIIGIGSNGSKIIEYIKKYQFISKKVNYEFLLVDNQEDFRKLNFEDTQLVITISGLAGDAGAKYTRLINKETKLENIKTKSIIILPFSYEGKNKGVNGFLERLIKINSNVEIYSNDDVTNEVPIEMGTSDIMRAFDKVIFDSLNKENQTEWNNHFLQTMHNGKIFKALATFSLRKLKLTLLNPNFKTIAETRLENNSKLVFGLQDKNNSISNVKDVKEVSLEMLKNYISKTN